MVVAVAKVAVEAETEVVSPTPAVVVVESCPEPWPRSRPTPVANVVVTVAATEVVANVMVRAVAMLVPKAKIASGGRGRCSGRGRGRGHSCGLSERRCSSAANASSCGRGQTPWLEPDQRPLVSTKAATKVVEVAGILRPKVTRGDRGRRRDPAARGRRHSSTPAARPPIRDLVDVMCMASLLCN